MSDHMGYGEPVHQPPSVPMASVPLSFLNEVLEVYYAARAGQLVPVHRKEQDEAREEFLRRIALQEEEKARNAGLVRFMGGFDVPGPGFEPRGVAVPREVRDAPVVPEVMEVQDGA